MEVWNGLTKDGRKISITHGDLMKWAMDANMQMQVGWSDAVQLPDGARLARSREGCLRRGWTDLAEAFPINKPADAGEGGE